MLSEASIHANPPRRVVSLHELDIADTKTNTGSKTIETRDRRDDEWSFAFDTRFEHDRHIELLFEDLHGFKEEFVISFDEIPILTHE
jgi:hypothetical protein